MKLTLASIVLAGIATSFALSQPNKAALQIGSARGTAVFVSDVSHKTLRVAAHVTVTFTDSSTGTEKTTQTDDIGDFRTEIPAGQYCISATTTSGETLRLSAQQVKCVNIKANQEIRIVMLVSRE